MRVHFIAIGGSAMHNLALALHHQGAVVTGSDDEIFEPSKSRLAKAGLLPETVGWDPSRIHNQLDAVILGMHARPNNPELLRAKELRLRIYSYPEFLYHQTKNKTRVVIGGSHGKTSITSMVLHVCAQLGVDTDYMVGAQLEGFERMVRLTSEAPFAVLEGDEYLSSPDDRRPKFHLYKPHVGLISGIAWDHINVFPTFEVYLEQFAQFIQLIEPNGTLIYCEEDVHVKHLSEGNQRTDLRRIPYRKHKHRIENGITYLLTSGGEVAIQIFGDHNLMNLSGAKEICLTMGIAETDFYRAIATFSGASKRLEKVGHRTNAVFYKDFAHSPSKLKATVSAMAKQFPERNLVCAMELHTFSSLTAQFLQEYAGSMNEADTAIVYFNPYTLTHKNLPPLSIEDIVEAFKPEIPFQVLTSSNGLVSELKKFMPFTNTNLLMMSSGNFDGLNFTQLATELGFEAV